MQETQKTQVQSLYQEGPLEDEWQPTPVSLPGKSQDRGAGQATVHGVTELDRTEHAWVALHMNLEMIKLSEVIQM